MLQNWKDPAVVSLGGAYTLDAAVSYAPRVTVQAGMLGGAPITHSQTNVQLMLSVH